jgi:hypothetical protein
VTRPESARQSNERIAEQAERLHFVSRVPMLCECSDGECHRIVLVALDDYRAARCEADFLTAPGHQIEGGTAVAREPEYWLQTAP